MFDDSDAPITPYVYWIVFDIGPGTSAILDGQLPPGAKQARGSAGYDRYDAPCPGSQGHKYRFTVYALNRVLNLPNGTSLLSAWQAIAAATIGRGRADRERDVMNRYGTHGVLRAPMSGFAVFGGEVSRFTRQVSIGLVTI